jgi:hypothetical protein
MREHGRALFLVAAVVLSTASAVQQPQPGAGSNDPYGCDVFCNHYLGCKQMLDQNNWQVFPIVISR